MTETETKKETENNCKTLFEDFISSSGPNLLLCEFDLDSKKQEPFRCYSSHLNTSCNDNITNNNYSKYWQKIKINEIKNQQFHMIHNFIDETKLFTISVIKKY